MENAATNKLARYHAKRDFKQTPEPSGKMQVQPGTRLVIQQHYARRLHFDLRLEIDGVLVSWAVTRGPSANPKDKRLAVRTEDHPLSYGAFEGLIPKPQYGGGTVILWESCNYRTLNGSASRGLVDGHIKFECLGQRMKGAWALVRMKTAEKAENWLLIKDRDEFAEKDDSLSHRFNTGLLSGLTQAQIEANKTAKIWKTSAQKKSGDKSPMPDFISPQLCKIADQPPVGDDWAFEMKYDGYRLVIVSAGQNVKIYTRSGLDWTNKFTKLVPAVVALGDAPIVMDGEAVVFNENGISDFPALVSMLKKERADSVVFIAFDLLIDRGEDIRKLPYVERKRRLRALLPSSENSVRYGEYVESNGEKMFKTVTEAGGEGIIAKLKTSPYVSGRSDSWLKIKGGLREDALIIGFMNSTKHDGFSSLLAAKKYGDQLVYVGRIGTGYNRSNRPQIDKLLRTVVPHPPKLTNVNMLPTSAKYIQPIFGAEVLFGGWTADRQLRQARFLGLQNDRVPESEPKNMVEKSAVKELPIHWRITHPDRILFPKDDVSKADVAAYYNKIKMGILPHLQNRPISLLRAPQSIDAETFFQRHPLKAMNEGIKEFGAAREPYFALVGEAGLAAAVQFGTIEFHGWNATLPKIDRPDRMIFDLDPDEEIPFAEVQAAANLLRDYLSAAGLQSWPLLSGGKGIHIVAPLDRSNTGEEVEEFCKAFAKRMENEKPKIFVANMSIAKRKKKIFIDYLRNRSKATAIVPWSLRARQGATVAAPLSWEIMMKAKSARAYTIVNFPQVDHWQSFFSLSQRLSSQILNLLKK